jgi:hypothetical protein
VRDNPAQGSVAERFKAPVLKDFASTVRDEQLLELQ